MCNCSTCKKGYKLVSSSIKTIMTQKIDSEIIAQTTLYAIYSELYDKQKLSALIRLKRKIINYQN